jgi:hypothetical protein
VLRNQKCNIRGRCIRNRFTGNYDCKDIDDQFILDEYEGTTTVIKDIKQIVEAPNAPEKKLYEKTKKSATQFMSAILNVEKSDTILMSAKEGKRRKKRNILNINGKVTVLLISPIRIRIPIQDHQNPKLVPI